MRFATAQWEALLEDGLWLANATHANAMARRLAGELAAIPGVALGLAVEANAVFAAFPPAMAAALRAAGAAFYPWVTPGDRFEGRLNRLVTSWATQAEEVDAFVTLARAEVP